MKTPFELMIAPTGARLGKANHPALPITPFEIAETVLACAAVGATAVHLHVRDASGRHSLSPAHYAEAMCAIRASTPLPIQVSTEGAGIYDVTAQRACLTDVETNDASIALREILTAPEQVMEIYALADRRGISAAQQSQVADLKPYLATPGIDQLEWTVCAFGRAEHACLLAALEAGGHARIGFENSREAADGTVHADNTASVAAFVKAAYAAGFEPRKGVL